MYLYDLERRATHEGNTKLILPTLFQAVDLKNDVRNAYVANENLIQHAWERTASYLPDDLTQISTVYVPAYDFQNESCEHWFLLVVKIHDKEVWIMDSIGVSSSRFTLALDLVSKK
ncbi:uncharacterized protein [Spinacia oleracea]|uniref:Ubiquitin-like protease family profile domain-containing protein n=1 Tax=Spinacia oleracea TaxID=3562 RepID=A0ABM3RHX5_SPIOL|nr:uncharacterized protein LOC130469775 [Spinacia oleracea]